MTVYIEDRDRVLIREIQAGLPLVPRPYALVGERCAMSEAEVIARLGRLIDSGVIKRLGVVVRHRELGYRANGMVVWKAPVTELRALGRKLGALPFVTLCYRRQARPPQWPYNLYTMIHGRDRAEVVARVAEVVCGFGLEQIPHEILFSTRRFKQCGARYGERTPAARREPAAPALLLPPLGAAP